MSVFRIAEQSPMLRAKREAVEAWLDFRAATADLANKVGDMQKCMAASDAATIRFAITSDLNPAEAETQITELGDHLWGLHLRALELFADTCRHPQDTERDCAINKCRQIWAEALGVPPEETDSKLVQDHLMGCDICNPGR